jgi:hypothetical protein
LALPLPSSNYIKSYLLDFLLNPKSPTKPDPLAGPTLAGTTITTFQIQKLSSMLIDLSSFICPGQKLSRKFHSQVITRQTEHFDQDSGRMKKRRVVGLETSENPPKSPFAKGDF